MSLRPAFGSSNQFTTLSVARLPTVDIREYSSVDLTGASDSSAGMQLAINETAAAKRRLYCPGGTYMMSVNSVPNLHIIGDPGWATRFIPPPDGFTGALMGTLASAVQPVSDCTFEYLFFDGQQQQRTVSLGHALLKAYQASRWTLRNVRIGNATSYGFGWQGYPTAPSDAHKYISDDLYMENCWIHDSGYLGGTVGVPRSGVSQSSDNIDIKSSFRVVMNKVFTAYSSDTCLDLRCRRGDLYGVFAYGGGATGIECDAQASTVTWPDNDTYISIHGGGARGNASGGLAISNSSGANGTACDVYVDVNGFHSSYNAGVGYGNNTPSAGSDIHATITGGKFHHNNYGMVPTAVQDLVIQGAQVTDNTVDGIWLVDQSGGTVTANISQRNGGFGITSSGTSDDLVVEDNDLRNNGNPISLVGTKNIAARNRTGVIDTALMTVASAASITLPTYSDYVSITGTATITSIARSYVGRRVTLQFASTATVTNNAACLLAGAVNFVATANDTLTLICHNVNAWLEVSRSVN